MKKFLFVFLISSALCLGIIAPLNAETTLFGSSWEDGQILGYGDRIEYSYNVAGYYNTWSPPPECSRRYHERVHSGNYSLMIAGYSRAPYAYCYYRVFDENILVQQGMKIGYWIYHAVGTPKVSVDGHFTDGTTLRDFYNNGYLTDQHGVRIHPGARRDPMGQWYYVEVDLSRAAGKTIDFIMCAFDNGSDGFRGQYRAYVDDFRIFTSDNGCTANVPADRWKGEYFNNINLSGNPIMMRDDGNGFLNFVWGSGSPNTSCGVLSDNFSARWMRTVNFSSGYYTFTVTADDGVRLWMDGQLKLDKWFDQATTTYSVGPIYLSGSHTIKMEYYEHGGGAVAKLSWQATANPCQATVPADRWKGEYFNNKSLSGTPMMVRDDGNGFLNFDWSGSSPSTQCQVSSDNFSVRWTRMVNFNPGNYQFIATADDGVRLWVDNQLKLDKWFDQGATTYTVGPIYLSGNHTIKMEYYDSVWNAVAQLSWKNVPVTPVEWPNEVSSANSDAWLAEHHNEIRVMRPRVLALNFVNHKSIEQMRVHMQQTINAIAEGSRYHGYKDSNASAFLRYELAYMVDLRDKVIPPNYPYRNSSFYPRENPVEGYWGFDYERLFTPEFTQLYGIADPENPGRLLSLCELIDRGLVHEVWVYCDGDVPDVSAAEILELKPYYDENRRLIPGAMNRCAGNGCFDEEDYIPCNRTVRIAHFNNTRGVGCFLESLSHGMESTGAWNRNLIPYLSRYFIPFSSHDLDTRYGLPVQSWYGIPMDCLDCLSYPTETSVAYKLPNQRKSGVINPYDPVCGNAHFPPNARRHYDMDSPFTVRTSCSYYRDGSGQTEEFTTEAFEAYHNVAPDCMGPWLVWWRQNMPGLDNDARDNDGKPMLNWWPFLFY